MMRLAFRPSGLALLAAALSAAVLTAGAAATGGTTIGQVQPGALVCGGPDTIVQSAPSAYAVPPGNWQVTGWATQAGSFGGQMSLIIFRPSGPSTYTVIGESPVETLTANTLNTFTLAAPIAVQGGDMLGMFEGRNASCAIIPGGTIRYSVAVGPPAVGSTFTPTGSQTARLNIAATLVPVGNTPAPDISHVFVCYSKYEQDGGAVFEAATAATLTRMGNWAPSAVAGNVQGGDNLGAYHLECNPPSTLKPTGMYVGGGGDIVSAAQAMNAGVGYYPIVA
jgi:hypothetical protein